MCQVIAPYTDPMGRLWALLLSAAAVGCFGGGSSTAPAPEGIDLLGGPVCPAAHLNLAARPLRYDGSSILIRFTEELELCRGLAIAPEVDDTLWDVGGMADGTDLLGYDGRVQRVRDREILWEVEGEGRVLDVFAITLAGTGRVGVLWGRSSGGSGDRLDILDANAGDRLATYDVSWDVRAAAASEREDRVVLLDRWAGFSEHVVDLSAEALGGTGELEVQAPRGVGSLDSLLVRPGQVEAVADSGILRWSSDTASMLGPASCRWSYWAGEMLPSECEYRGMAADPSDPRRWLTLCHGPDLAGAIVSLGPRDSCAILLPERRLPNHEITDLAWSGR